MAVVMRELSVRKKSKSTPRLWTEFTYCGCEPSKCFPLPTNITFLFLGFSFSQLCFNRELISSRHWLILVAVMRPYVVKDRYRCVVHILLGLEFVSSDHFTISWLHVDVEKDWKEN